MLPVPASTTSKLWRKPRQNSTIGSFTTNNFTASGNHPKNEQPFNNHTANHLAALHQTKARLATVQSRRLALIIKY